MGRTVAVQVEHFLDFEGENAAPDREQPRLDRPLSAIDFLRDIGKHFRVGKMLDKDAVSTRLNSEAGISYTEFSYQILQGLDFLELYRQYGCVLQTGGSDQWGNLTAGVDLIRRAEGASVHALGTPLITKADGTKFGKTETGTRVARSRADLPVRVLPVLAQRRGRGGRAVPQGLHLPLAGGDRGTRGRDARRSRILRLAQRALAEDVTTLVHGADQFARAEAASKALFGQGDLAELDERTVAAALAELPTVKVTALSPYFELFAETGIVPSRSAARRAIQEGGAYVNNAKIEDVDAEPVQANLLHGRWLLLRRGRRTLGAVELSR